MDGFALRNYQLILFQFLEFTHTLKRSQPKGNARIWLFRLVTNDIFYISFWSLYKT